MTHPRTTPGYPVVRIDVHRVSLRTVWPKGKRVTAAMLDNMTPAMVAGVDDAIMRRMESQTAQLYTHALSAKEGR